MRYRKRISFAIIVPLLLIITLETVNLIFYNNVMSMSLPVAVIISTVIGIRNAKKMSLYIYIASIVLISIAVYLVLPGFTVAESEKNIQKELSEVVTLELLKNTPIYTEEFDVITPKWFYTYRVTESNDIEYILIFNPKTGEFLKRS
ncbi:hypothetical protein [Sporosarcina sp. BP05]|uniref:hypothetical protein n=1 Tax=Sporosarcina sp. BP05 TaxID=2758726 RepID=UPI001644318A|nr:hypothetical protein [Sporosarcina sp. BP05]